MFKLYKYKAGHYANKTRRLLNKTMKGLGQEANETKEMTQSFFRLLQIKLNIDKRKTPPTDEEIKAAIEQLKDLGRFSVFTGIFLLPGGGLSIIGLEILAKKMGIKNFTLIPSAFREQKDIKKQNINE